MDIPGYAISRELGKGGMATVYLGTQESFGRKCAIKVLSPQMAMDEEFAMRFLREAKIVAQMSHPHIIPVYDVGQRNGQFYMSMDYLAGGDLSRWIKAGLEEPEVMEITEQIASALQYAHGKGYVHRDIKPDNIMFREDNSAVLTDFGIACLQDTEDRITQAGSVIGTPKYMSPEQLQGHEVDGRTDIYALGIVFYEMLMKKLPFQAKEFAALALKHIQEPIPTLPPLFSRYQSFLEKIIAKDPEQRFKNGREVIKALKMIKESETQARVAAQSPVPAQAQKKAIPSSSPKTAPVDKSRKASEKSPSPKPISQKQDAKLKDVESVYNRPRGIKQPSKSSEKKKPATSIKPGIHFEETSSRKAGLLKRYTLHCHIAANDAHNFNIIFGQVSTKVLDWQTERQKKCTSVVFHVTTNTMAFDKARKVTDNFYRVGGDFSFLQKLKVLVELINPGGKVVDSYELS